MELQQKTSKHFFITATDTGSGKTTVTTKLITTLQKLGYQVIGCKPIACGFDETGSNEDVRCFQAINSISLSLDQINPARFSLAASPNIAASEENATLTVRGLCQKLNRLKQLPTDFIFFEGIGGWKVPINTQETTANLVTALQSPVILVVGVRVGCLNHALLTWEALQKDRVETVGWLANIVDPTTPAIDKHLSTLCNWLKLPYLGMLPFAAPTFKFLDLRYFIEHKKFSL